MKYKLLKKCMVMIICIALLGQGIVVQAETEGTNPEAAEIIDEEKHENIDQGVETVPEEIAEPKPARGKMQAEAIEGKLDETDKADDRGGYQKLTDAATGIVVEGKLPKGIKLGVMAISGNLTEHADFENDYANLVMHYNMQGYDVIQAYYIWFEIDGNIIDHTQLEETLKISMPNPDRDYEFLLMSRLGSDGLVEKRKNYVVDDDMVVISTNDVGDYLFLKKDDDKKQFVDDLLRDAIAYRVLEDDETGVRVEGQFPGSAALTVKKSPIVMPDADNKNPYAKMLRSYGEAGLEGTTIYQITVTCNDQDIQPEFGAVITLPEGGRGAEKVVYTDYTGNHSKSLNYTTEGKKIIVETEELGEFTVFQKAEAKAQSVKANEAPVKTAPKTGDVVRLTTLVILFFVSLVVLVGRKKWFKRDK